MNILKTGLLAAAASVAFRGAAMAQDEGLKLSYNVGVASDYIFRGVSNTNEDPQVFGGVDATYGIGYVGVWASNVDFGTSEPSAEIDIYAGVKPTIGDVNLDLGVIYYGYVKDEAPESNRTIAYPGQFGYFEVKAAASKAFGPATVGVAGYYSPEFPADGGQAVYVELNGSMPAGEKLTVSGAFGHQSVDAKGYYAGIDGEYSTWNLGVTAAITDNLSADIRYSDTNGHEYGEIFGQHFTVSLKAAF